MKKETNSSMHIYARYEGDADPALICGMLPGSGRQLGQDDSKEFLRVVYSLDANVDDVTRNLREIADILERDPDKFWNRN